MRLGGGSARVRRRALVLFTGKADLWWLRLLRPGFRHCLVAVEQPGGWIVLNPLSHRVDIEFCPGIDEAVLRGHFEATGGICVATRLGDPPPRPAPWRPFTCVEAVLRVLGLRAPWVFTPWQLYRVLNCRGSNT